MNASDDYIPRTLDDPPLIVWWELDEFATLAGGVLLGMLANAFVVFLGVAAIVAWRVNKLKRNGGRAALIDWLYWHLPWSLFRALLKVEVTPPNHIREWQG